jgi:LacI family transcriptional regulator
MAVRMKDIARELGVSVVTVSKVLRNHSDISEATRRRVQKLMKERNYQPNFAARALVTGRTYTVGLVVPDLVHPFFAEVAKGLSGFLRTRGYNLILASSEEDPELEAQEITRLVARRLDAIVIASTQWTVDSFRQIEEQETSYVLVDRRFTGLEANFVGVDDEAVGGLATEHLISVGCRRIAHIRGPQVSTATGRLEGYKRALARHKLDSFPNYIPAAAGGDDNSEARGRKAMGELLKLSPRPDGVFCYNDPTAMGAINEILGAGLGIPEDIAVIGCGNVHYDSSLRVPLSSIDQKSALIGQRAAKLALRLVETKGGRPKTILLEPKLVVRASTHRGAPAGTPDV